MAGVNKVILVGNLGADPDLRQAGESPVCDLRLATNSSWTDKSGNKQEETEWHRLVVWGKRGENCGKYLKKGSCIFAEGRLKTRKWDDKDGNTRYTTEVVCHDVQFLDKKEGSSGRGSSGGPNDRYDDEF